jgi:hypothetical protein
MQRSTGSSSTHTSVSGVRTRQATEHWFKWLGNGITLIRIAEPASLSGDIFDSEELAKLRTKQSKNFAIKPQDCQGRALMGLHRTS